MGIKDLTGLIPDGNVGLAIKVLAAIVGVAWWTSAPGADEASDFKAKAEKRRGYTRHYALKGRGRKDSWLHSVKEERPELTPSRAACEASAPTPSERQVRKALAILQG